MIRFLLVLMALATLAVVGLFVVTLGAATLGAVLGWRRLRARAAAFRIRRTAKAHPGDPLDDAWARAGDQADWAVTRLAAAQTSCDRLLAIADAEPLSADAVDWANVIRRRVPDLVEACLAECVDATAAERRRNLDDLVDSLERIGAEAERRRDRFREARVSPFAVQRTYVDQRTRIDPLG